MGVGSSAEMDTARLRPTGESNPLVRLLHLRGGIQATVLRARAMNRARKYSLRRRVMVTGGAGFIGSHLCDRLVKDGCDVLCVDNFYTGTRDNIVHLMSSPHFELMRHDVTFPLYV